MLWGDDGAAQILVVEDDGALNEMLEQIICDEGYSVVAVANGRAALTYLRTHRPPSLILLDLMMPIMNGFQFLAEQQSDPLLRDIPVVVLTADSRAADYARSQAVASVINKPLPFDDLLDVVVRYCGRR